VGLGQALQDAGFGGGWMNASDDNEGQALGAPVQIAPSPKELRRLALGCWAFGGTQWGGQDDADSLAAMSAALSCGINHFDTATGYGAGRSERLVGRLLAAGDPDSNVFLASKGRTQETSDRYMQLIDDSLDRLGADCIDLYYIHWPVEGLDLRPTMQALEQARAAGKIKCIGVSNFSVEQMDQVSEVGRIDAHQLCYNLFWRYPERDVIPYCRQHNIAVVTYSSIAQGILTGKFSREPKFEEGDSRAGMLHFDPEVWPHVYEGVQQLKQVASEADRPLAHLAIQWVAAQSGINSILVGARNAQQVDQNTDALASPVSSGILERMTGISNEVCRHVPDVGNIFRFYP